MRSIKEIYFIHRIKRNQRRFRAMERAVGRARDLSVRCARAKKAADFAVSHTTDVFASDVLERAFTDLAQTIHVPQQKNYTPGTTLHVMTEAYTSGGHTRCVERWAQQMVKYQHSCVLLRQTEKIPPQLRDVMQKSGGDLFVLDKNETIVQSAIRLRQMASEYELIVLHIHMNDPIALVAFGTPEFERPVIFFNHADHAFWIGVSISDYVADLNNNRNELTRTQRGAARASVLGIPADNTNVLKINKDVARKKLGIAPKQKMIFSSGQATKYDPLGHPDFSDIISDLIDADNDIVFYVAGANADSIFWPRLRKKYPNNLVLVGRLDYATEYPLYLGAADLVIDSTPVGGETAIIDAVRAGKPVLTLNSVVQADFLITSGACCHTYSDLLVRAHKILDDKQYAAELFDDVWSRFVLETDVDEWCRRCEQIIKSLPSHHHVYDFKPGRPGRKITEYSYSTTRWTQPFKKKKIWSNLARWFLYIQINRCEQVVRICGITLINRQGGLYDKCTKDFEF